MATPLLQLLTALMQGTLTDSETAQWQCCSRIGHKLYPFKAQLINCFETFQTIWRKKISIQPFLQAIMEALLRESRVAIPVRRFAATTEVNDRTDQSVISWFI